MGHDWILDVLTDMQSYAERNGLPGLAGKIAETLTLARIEVGVDPGPDHDETLPRVRPGRQTH